jgi:hypothetical protein
MHSINTTLITYCYYNRSPMPGSPNISSASSGNAAMQEAMRKMEARLSKLELAYTSVTAEVSILTLLTRLTVDHCHYC